MHSRLLTVDFILTRLKLSLTSHTTAPTCCMSLYTRLVTILVSGIPTLKMPSCTRLIWDTNRIWSSIVTTLLESSLFTVSRALISRLTYGYYYTFKSESLFRELQIILDILSCVEGGWHVHWKYIYVICRPGGPYWEKLCQRSWVRPEAALKTEGTVFPNTDRPRPANNVLIFFPI